MFQIYPISDSFINKQLADEEGVVPVDYDFSGLFFFLKYNYHNSKDYQYKTLSFGHAFHYPMEFSDADLLTSSVSAAPDWFSRLLISSRNKSAENELVIKKENLRPLREDVLILNCLDTCYGHVIWKMFNIERHLKHHFHLDLILIIPENMRWFVPEGVAEIWLIKCKLHQLSGRIKNLDGWIKEEVKNFKTVFLSRAYVHLDHESIDLKGFHKTEKFDLEEFSNKQQCVTFILRENRFWLANKIDELLFKIGIKTNTGYLLKGYFVRKQNRLVYKTALKLKKVLPELMFYVTGVGRTGKFPSSIQDYRAKDINAEIEKRWCEIAANSQVVVGIHGSHMIIPTSLSAGFVELLPAYKIDNLTEDIAHSGRSRTTLFLGRFLPGNASSGQVAKHIKSMINFYPQLKNNTSPKGD